MSYLSASRHLQKVETWDFETSFPPGHFEYGHIHPPDVCMFADEFSSSYGPMGLFELYAGARMTPTSRFHRSMSFMHVVRTLHLAFARYERDVRNRTDRWNTPEPWHTMLQRFYNEFFVSMGLPGMTRMPTLTGAHDDIHMHSSAVLGSLAAWPFFPSSKDPELAEFFTTNGEPSPIDDWGHVPPLTSRQRAPTRHLATTQAKTNPIPKAEFMPFSIPVPWDVILERLFAYTPDNNWVIPCNPNEQRLEGDSAQAFRHCRAACKGFDDYMLRYMARFTMTPTRYSSAGDRRCTFEIEFEQRELIVNAQSYRCKNTRLWVIRHIYQEYRRYSQEHLRARRSLVRRELAHDKLPTLRKYDPSIQYWIDQAADSTARQRLPFFLSRASVHRFQKHCRHTSWNFNSWADALCDSLHDYADREPEAPWPPEELLADLQWTK